MVLCYYFYIFALILYFNKEGLLILNYQFKNINMNSSTLTIKLPPQGQPQFNPRMMPDNHPELFPYVLLSMVLIAF
jgi:hypothetical protein